MRTSSLIKLYWLICVTGLAAGGCGNRLVKAKAAQDGALASSTGAPSQNEPFLRYESVVTVAGVEPIHFDFDSASLDDSARQRLKINARWLQEHADSRIQVAGHCDERGTVQYNLALGQNRAKAVRDYYAKLGIAAGRIATISYGKEKPLCRESSEACWRLNRRAESLIALPKAAKR